VHLGVGPAGGEVVAVEGDVDVPERDLVLEQVAHEPVQARREVRPAAVDPHERHGPAGVLLHDLVRDAHERAADVVLVEDDLRFGHSVLPGLTGPG
jgi:hypothetical protein